jgi:hypothetical protein
MSCEKKGKIGTLFRRKIFLYGGGYQLAAPHVGGGGPGSPAPVSFTKVNASSQDSSISWIAVAAPLLFSMSVPSVPALVAGAPLISPGSQPAAGSSPQWLSSR